MKKAATRLDYAARIERVAAHITANLDRPLDLARLAEIACFSPYHFHRLYRLVLGETPDQTVRRLRLHRAAAALSRNEEPLARIAREAGYGSAEAFSRAFAAAPEPIRSVGWRLRCGNLFDAPGRTAKAMPKGIGELV